MRTALLTFTVLALSAAPQSAVDDSEWPFYGRDAGGSKYSPLSQINRENVRKLKIAWTYRTGDMYNPKDDPRMRGGRASAFEATPIYAGGTLYLDTAFGRVIALDPETGKQLWNYDPHVDIHAGYGDFASRGVSMWIDPSRDESAPCRRRIFVASIDARLTALNAATGKPCADFGKDGEISLRTGLRNPPEDMDEYEETSPPAVIDDLVIVGSGIADNSRVTAPSGEVRAYDARTGKLRWTFDPMPGQRTGAANAWSIISVDPDRHLVFVPTGSASPDYYGGERLGNNSYANSVVALRAQTGQVVWAFQTVHHDLWDYDVASQPTLFTMRRDGKEIPAIAVGSKTGNLFLLNRETGEPIFGVAERPVPKSDVPGEESWPTQPFPRLPGPLAPQKMTAADVWGPTPADRKWCADQIQDLRSEGIFTPPSIRGSLMVPGNVGGMAWGGTAFDPRRGLLFVPANRLPAIVHLIPRDEYKARKEAPGLEYAAQAGTPYGMSRRFLVSPSGLPCTAPPWGTIAAIDAATGEKRWESPTGYFPHLASFPESAKWGSISLGGPVATAGGIVFMGGSLDPNLHAWDSETGAELWAGKLPTSARATPMTFRAKNGKQYVVIAAGGHEFAKWTQGDYLVAFALP